MKNNVNSVNTPSTHFRIDVPGAAPTTGTKTCDGLSYGIKVTF